MCLLKIDLFIKIATGPEISIKISGRTLLYHLKIDLFIQIAPQKFCLKYLNIAPKRVQRRKFLKMLKICPTYHVNAFSSSGHGHFFNIAPKRAQRGNFEDAENVPTM